MQTTNQHANDSFCLHMLNQDQLGQVHKGAKSDVGNQTHPKQIHFVDGLDGSSTLKNRTHEVQSSHEQPLRTRLSEVYTAED